MPGGVPLAVYFYSVFHIVILCTSLAFWKSDIMTLNDELTFIICLLQRLENLTVISILDVNISQVLNEVSSNFL